MREININADYETLWKPILENPDGSINKEQLIKELADYSALMSRVASLYCLATGNRVSYITTMPETVYDLFLEEREEAYDAGYQDACRDLGETEV